MAEFFGKFMTPLIIIGGIGMAVYLIMNYIKLYTKKASIDDAMNRRNRESYLNARTGEIQEREREEAVTPDTIRECQKSFNEVVSGYNACIQLIPLFPLMGILGTVSGLIMQLKGQDLDMLFNSLDTALSSTFWGLIAAIALKVISTASAKLIEDTENILDDYDKKFENSLKLGNITSV